jgi:hypothetical protein
MFLDHAVALEVSAELGTKLRGRCSRGRLGLPADVAVAAAAATAPAAAAPTAPAAELMGGLVEAARNERGGGGQEVRG